MTADAATARAATEADFNNAGLTVKSFTMHNNTSAYNAQVIFCPADTSVTIESGGTFTYTTDNIKNSSGVNQVLYGIFDSSNRLIFAEYHRNMDAKFKFGLQSISGSQYNFPAITTNEVGGLYNGGAVYVYGGYSNISVADVIGQFQVVDGVITSKGTITQQSITKNLRLTGAGFTDANVIPVPTIADVTYDGLAHTAVVNSSAFTISGTNTATYANYVNESGNPPSNQTRYNIVTLTLNSGYVWSDGTTAEKTLNW